ncbi:MAG: methyltransferase domain-containing protein [Desulfobacterales bacterium]|nr:methyltransferase domain-containing protein [Desulfobacterales bacterium]
MPSSSNPLPHQVACPVCWGKSVIPVLHLPAVPVLCNRIWPTREAARDAPRGEMRLVQCLQCEHLFNAAFVPDLIDYGSDYDNTLHGSARFRAYAEELAADLLRRHNLFGKRILEIGCGKGEFLKLLCHRGNCFGVGLDPGGTPARPGFGTSDRVSFYQDSFSSKYVREGGVDLVCCRHVLEHLHRPAGLIRRIHGAVDAHAVVFFEVPNTTHTLVRGAIWDVIYEHYSYFTPTSLVRLFQSTGFDVTDLRESFAGQFLRIEARKAGPGKTGVFLPPMPCQDSRFGATKGFSELFFQRIEKARQIHEGLKASGKHAVVWGAGSKGVSFLNSLPEATMIDGVIDINPAKQGGFIAGTGHRILAPETLAGLGPGIVLVMNPVYTEEIRQTTLEMGLTLELILP